MKITIQVDREDGTSRTLKISPLAIIGWERETGRKISDLSGGGMGMADVATMALAQQALEDGGDRPSLDDWLAGVEALTPVVADPPSTAEAPSGG